MRLYADISKVDAVQRMVWGYASTEAKDRVGETVLKSAMEGALEDYLQFPTIREMHQLSAVGKTTEAEVTEKGLYIGAKIVDEKAWEKVTEGVYKGFSIGGKALARDPLNKTIITQVRLDEISLVDRPANPEAKIDLFKAAVPDDDPPEVLANDTIDSQIEAGADAVAKAAGKALEGSEGGAATTVAGAASETAGELSKVDGETGKPTDPVARAEAAVAALEAVAKPDDKKGMYEVSSFANLLSSISYLMKSADYEAEYEGDNSPVPEQLRAWLKTGAGIFVAMAQEETAELVSSLAKAVETKSGASDDLQKVVEAKDADLQKAMTDIDDLRKALGERDAKLGDLADRVEKTVSGLTERIAVLEAQPAAPKTAGAGHSALTVVEKTTSGSSPAAEPDPEVVEKALAAMTDDERAMLLTKVALKRPIPIRTRSFVESPAA